MPRPPIYLDNHATTPVDPRVADVVLHHMVETFGNPHSSDHVFGDEAEAACSHAAIAVRSLLDAPDHRVVFTSGATEAINVALRGFALATARTATKKARIGLAPIEHQAVIATARALERDGVAEIRHFAVDGKGRLDLADVADKCRRGLDLVCVMAANNEVGNLYPLSEIAALVHDSGGVLFTDATQATGKIPLSVSGMGIDLLVLSAHKMYGPKGVGALIARPGLPLESIFSGGRAADPLRPGTPNIPGVAGLGAAAGLRQEEMRVDEQRIGDLRNQLQSRLVGEVECTVINGDTDNRLAGNLHIAFPGVPNQAVIARVRQVLAVSTGSACEAGIEAASHVLRAMRLPPEVLESSIRVGVGKFNTEEEIEAAAELLSAAVEEVQELLSPSH